MIRFYDDVLEAAAMVRDFDVVLVTDDGLILHDFEDILDCHIEDCYRGKYFVHADSDPVFNPQGGDVIDFGSFVIRNDFVEGTLDLFIFSDASGIRCHYDQYDRCHPPSPTWEYVEWGDFDIIQRNGKSFHMPKGVGDE